MLTKSVSFSLTPMKQAIAQVLLIAVLAAVLICTSLLRVNAQEAPLDGTNVSVTEIQLSQDDAVSDDSSDECDNSEDDHDSGDYDDYDDYDDDDDDDDDDDYGTLIRNIATISYQLGGGHELQFRTNPADICVLRSEKSSDIELLRYAPAAPDAVLYPVNGTDVLLDDTMAPSGPPTDIDGSVLDVSSTAPLMPALSLLPEETVFILVKDPDANQDPTLIDTVDVVLTVNDTGDTETVSLYESGPDTGIFTGYVKTKGSGSAVANDGSLLVNSGSIITAAYQDATDPDDISTDTVSVHSSGHTFSRATGKYIDGTVITLIDADTGQPATIYGTDGVSMYPSTITSGERAVDEIGKAYTFALGEFLFPLVPPGNYYFEIVPPPGYIVSSPVPTDADSILAMTLSVDADHLLIPLVGFHMDNESHGDVFNVLVLSALGHNIPLEPITVPPDPRGSVVNLELTKSVSVSTAQVGDFLRYELKLTNQTDKNATNLTVYDALPSGFRYQQDTFRVDGALVTPTVSTDGQNLAAGEYELADGQSLNISYVVEVTVGTQTGLNINTAVVESPDGFRSDIAQAEVRISDPFMRDVTTILGRISAGSCNLSDNWPREIVQGESIEGIRLYMEDGTYAVTDADGQYHFVGVKPGTHVVQIDKLSLPNGYIAVLCEENTRFTGKPTSQFVNVSGGALWRADFYLENTCEKPVAESASFILGKGGSRAYDRQEPEVVLGGANNVSNSNMMVEDFGPPTNACNTGDTAAATTLQQAQDSQSGTAITVISLRNKFNSAWLARQSADLEWVYPDAAGSTASPSVKFGIKHASDLTISVLLNGEPVSALHTAGKTTSPNGQVSITHWRGVAIKDGANLFSVIAKNSAGQIVSRLEQDIHFISDVYLVKYVPEESTLIADGRTKPEIAIRLTDAAGRTVRSGLIVEVEVASPYRAAGSADRLTDSALTEIYAAKAKVHVGENGIIKVALEPTMRTGAVGISVTLSGTSSGIKRKNVEAWLVPGEREWILVGLAEGSIALNTARNHMEAGGVDEISTDGRIAFFAKGTIKGKWLLTMAVDTDRHPGERDDEVYRQIDPNAYYTLYGDTTVQDNEADSRYPLYLRLETNNFYAMFGDFDTDMSTTELTAYGRRLSGFKVAYRDETFDVIAFGSETNQAFVLEEKLSLGTSGPYRLANTPIVRSSEEITIETRDRLRNDVVVSTSRLIRFVDYSINYETGVVTLKQPVPVTDFQFNPNILKFAYEAVNVHERSLTYGVRATAKLLDDQVEVGVSYIHDGGSITAPDVATDVVGVDLRAQITEKTEVRAEYATSTRESGETGDAFLLDLLHEDEAVKVHAYIQQQDAEFGFGQLSLATQGTRRYGLGLDYSLQPGLIGKVNTGDVTVGFEVFREDALTKDASRTVAEADIAYRGGYGKLSFGVRHINYSGLDVVEPGSVTQLLFSARHQIKDTQASVYTNSEWAVQGRNSTEFDRRLTFGIDNTFSDWLTGSFVMERNQRQDGIIERYQVGFSATPWEGGSLSTSLQSTTGLGENPDSLVAVLGVGQTIAVTDKLSISAGYEEQKLFLVSANEGPASPFTDQLNSEEYKVAHVGFGFIEDNWSTSTRTEIRLDEEEKRLSMHLGLAGEFSDELGAAIWLDASTTRPEDEDADTRDQIAASIGAVYRSLDRGPIILNRLDAEYSRQGAEENIKIIDNLAVNFRLGERGQASVHLGAKYVEQSIDDQEFSGLSYFAGTELSYDVTEKLDIGFHAGVANSVNSGVTDYVWGPSVGYNVLQNARFSLGYNFEGLRDKDFGGTTFSSQGPYVKYQIKFDQDTIRDALNLMRGE